MTSRSIRIKRDNYSLSAIVDLPSSQRLKPEFGWPVVILLHGWRGNKHSSRNRELAKKLTTRGIATLRLDMRGHGKSGGDIRRVSVKTQVEDVVATLDYILRSHNLNHDRVGIVGASIGGTTALAAISTLPVSMFTCAVLISPRTDFGPMKSGTYSFTDSKSGRRIVNTQMLRNGKATNFYANAERVVRPVLVLHGTNDTVIPIEQSRKLAEVNRRFYLAEISGGDHTMRNPDHLWSVVSQTVEHISNCISGNPA
jgi:uncharacterized protein